MTFVGRFALAFGVVLALAGCSVGSDALWPSSESEEANQQQTDDGPPLLGSGQFQPGGVTPGAPTGTIVGDKVQQLRGDLQSIQAQISDENVVLQQHRSDARISASNYHDLVGKINARLQVGTTPGNPELVAQWNQAQVELGRVDDTISGMNSLANNVAATSSQAAFLLDSIRATFSLSGGIEEDHRQLTVLEDEANQTTVLIDRLFTELSDDIVRASRYLTNERANLNAMSVAIKNGDYLGGSLTNRAYGTPSQGVPGQGAGLVGRAQPLVVIRFEQNNVDYESALYTAVNRALELRPQAAFDVVAVAPGSGPATTVNLANNETQRNAESVVRSLRNMGLPQDRITLSRTTNPSSTIQEVHLYVR